jgi:phosphate transport system substrate-binding protein
MPVLFLAVFLTGCGSGPDRIVVTGSSTMAPLLLELGNAFEAVHGVQVDVHSGGSGRGLQDVRAGAADIGMVSRALTASEDDLHGRVIARDGVALIVNASNSVDALSDDALTGLFQGRWRTWASQGGSAEPVTVIHKAAGRSTQEVFLAHFELPNASIEAHVIAGENQEVIRLVAGNHGAIGYVSIGTAEHEAGRGVPIRLLPLNGVAATVENVRAGRYPLARELTLVSREPPAGATAALLDFVGSADAESIYGRYGFIPASR